MRTLLGRRRLRWSRNGPTPGEDSSSPGLRRTWTLRRNLLLVMTAVMGWAAFVRHFWLERDSGEGPAGATVARGPFMRPWTKRPVLLLGLGDSVTAGFGASPGHSYFDRLARTPVDEFETMRGLSLGDVLPGLQTQNAAVSGSTSPEHLDRQIARLPVFEENLPGLVVMTTGGNDLIHDYGRSAPREGAMYGATWTEAQPWIENFERRLEQMRVALRSRFPGGCELFIANIYDPTDGDGTAGLVGLPYWRDGLEIHAAYNARLERLAARYPDVHLVDIRSPLLGHGIYCRQFWRRHYQWRDPHYWYDPNFEDPNDRGYDAIRRAFLNCIVASRQRLQGEWNVHSRQTGSTRATARPSE